MVTAFLGCCCIPIPAAPIQESLEPDSGAGRRDPAHSMALLPSAGPVSGLGPSRIQGKQPRPGSRRSPTPSQHPKIIALCCSQTARAAGHWSSSRSQLCQRARAAFPGRFSMALAAAAAGGVCGMDVSQPRSGSGCGGAWEMLPEGIRGGIQGCGSSSSCKGSLQSLGKTQFSL